MGHPAELPSSGPSLERFREELDPGRPVGQSYDSLAANLRLLRRPDLKTLLFTSTQPEEGKTTVVGGLALALARTGKRVLAVDADLRRPSLHRVFSLPNREGLGALLSGSASPAELIQKVEVPGGRAGEPCELGVISAGPATNSPPFQTAPPAVLSSLLADLAASCELLLIDSPPILAVDDALLLAPRVDGVVLVLQAGAVPERDALKAKQRLERAGGELLGVVMNRFDPNLHGPGLHPYDAYYAAKP